MANQVQKRGAIARDPCPGHQQYRKGRLCHHQYLFIIDGLDEYNRDNIGKTELVDMSLEMASCPNIKLLLSSRPEMPFATGFRRCPSLRLETLTKPDITAYINAKLWSNSSFRDVTNSEELELRTIAEFVSKNAEGVF